MARTVTLRTGGTITLSASVDAFDLSSRDRAFIQWFIDRLDEYEARGAAEPGGTE